MELVVVWVWLTCQGLVLDTTNYFLNVSVLSRQELKGIKISIRCAVLDTTVLVPYLWESGMGKNLIKHPLMSCIWLELMFLEKLCKSLLLFSQENMMTSSNLAICVGPCILWSSDPHVVTGAEYAADVSKVTKLLIDDFAEIFGSDVPPVFVTSSSSSSSNNRQKLPEKSVTRTPPLTKPVDSIKPFALQRKTSRHSGILALASWSALLFEWGSLNLSPNHTFRALFSVPCLSQTPFN